MTRSKMKILIIALSLAVSVYLLAHIVIVPLATVFNASTPTGETPADWGYGFSDILVKRGPSRLAAWYVEGGGDKGQIILLANNGGNRSAPLMRWIAEILLGEGYDVVLADPRGQGSSGGLKTYGPGESIDVAHLVETLAEERPELPIGGLGFSLGAAALIRAMGMDDRIQAVAAFAPYARLDGELIRQEISYQTGESWRGFGIIPCLLAKGLRFWALSTRRIPQPVDAAAELGDRHLLLMHFRGDPELPVEYSLEIHEAATQAIELHGGPGTASLHVYEGSNHLPWRRDSNFNEVFASRVLAFFEAAFSEE